MAEDQWISVAYAADIVATSEARKLIQRAWKLGAIRLRGVPPGEGEPIEIPPSEGGRVDCKKARIVIGRFCTTFLNVTMKWADVKRLAQADFERQLLEAESPSSPPLKSTRSASGSANAPNISSAAEIGRTGGKKSGEVRRAGRKWVPHATELAEAAVSREPAASIGRIAGLIADNWKLREVKCPGHDTLVGFVSERRASGQLPPRAK
jgi:hypothetical protein